MARVHTTLLSSLPPAHALLATEVAQQLRARFSATVLRDLARGVLQELREAIEMGSLSGDRTELTHEAARRLQLAAQRRSTPRLRMVLNATGVVLHTNLGRAPLGADALAHIASVCGGYAAVEYDLVAGERGHRDAIVAPLFAAMLGAEDATVVNNCAAAVLVAATAFASGREVVVSRGELVEIGGGFRIPDVVASCGARLIEVGTTNRTRLRDYEQAMGPNTGAVLKVHRSNFALVGFTEEAPVRELAALCRARGVPLLEDLGSGAMLDTARLGIEHERTAREALDEGVDLVMVSGDKLFGGPQAGIIAGRREAVATVRRHPLMRALRPGRLVLAALEATLRAHVDGRAERDVPAVAMLAQSDAVLRGRAEVLCAMLRSTGVVENRVSVVRVAGRVGGGTLPMAAPPSWAVRIEGSAYAIECAMRSAPTPVVGRVADGALLLDIRTLRDEDLDDVVKTVVDALCRVTTENLNVPTGTMALDDVE